MISVFVLMVENVLMWLFKTTRKKSSACLDLPTEVQDVKRSSGERNRQNVTKLIITVKKNTERLKF